MSATQSDRKRRDRLADPVSPGPASLERKDGQIKVTELASRCENEQKDNQPKSNDNQDKSPLFKGLSQREQNRISGKTPTIRESLVQKLKANGLSTVAIEACITDMLSAVSTPEAKKNKSVTAVEQ